MNIKLLSVMIALLQIPVSEVQAAVGGLTEAQLANILNGPNGNMYTVGGFGFEAQNGTKPPLQVNADELKIENQRLEGDKVVVEYKFIGARDDRRIHRVTIPRRP